MNVVYDYQTFFNQKYGGISRYFFQLAKHLDQELDLLIIAPFYCNEYIGELDREIVKGLKIKQIKNKFVNHAFRNFNHYLSKIIAHNVKPDIIHETFFSNKTPFSSDIPNILTVYDMIHELFDNYQPPYKKGWSIQKNAVARAEHIICISENTKKDLIECYHVEESKVSVIHLGFEFPKLVCNQYIITDKPYLLYVGWREWYKNFGSFLKCYSTSKRLMKDFNIVAFGGGNFSNIEKQLFKSLGIQEGQVIQVSGDDEKLARYYYNATAFVFPSLYEGFGLPPLEAMAHDCPVISSNTSSMPEVIGDAAEYFDPKSEEQTVHAIENVVYSETRKKELIMKGRKRHKRFSWAKCSNETHQIYKQFL